ncbi:MAG TPA: DUF1761 domain-containing protein [Thermohalobaculum sp.]|nr:DUF1761 domain-containing protein [Thermohalobaculum sp.]
MQILAVLLAAAAGFGAGSVWYMLNAKRWMAAVDGGEATMQSSKAPLSFAIGIAANLMTAGLMRHILASAGVTGAGAALIAGLGLGLFAVAPWVLTNYAFAGRPKALWWIDAGHVVLACAAIGLVLGLFL